MVFQCQNAHVHRFLYALEEYISLSLAGLPCINHQMSQSRQFNWIRQVLGFLHDKADYGESSYLLRVANCLINCSCGTLLNNHFNWEIISQLHIYQRSVTCQYFQKIVAPPIATVLQKKKIPRTPQGIIFNSCSSTGADANQQNRLEKL